MAADEAELLARAQRALDDADAPLRELAALSALAGALPADLAAKISAKEAVRKHSHRDPLRNRERQLREDATLADLKQLRADCVHELPPDDLVLKKAESSLRAREKEARSLVEQTLAMAGKTSMRRLDTLLKQCKADFGSDSSLTRRVAEALEARRKSHWHPLSIEVDAAKQSTMAELAKLEARVAAEVPEGDVLLTSVKALVTQREADFRAPLVKRFTALMRNPQKMTLGLVNELANDCNRELAPTDALMGQVKSAQETRLMEENGMKHVHVLDQLERGEKSDDLPGTASKRKKTKGSSSGSSSLSSAALLSTSLPVVFASGLAKDLGGGGGHVSKLYKLAVVVVVLIYAAVLGYSTSLTLLVLGHNSPAQASAPQLGSSAAHAEAPPPPPAAAVAAAHKPAEAAAQPKAAAEKPKADKPKAGAAEAKEDRDDDEDDKGDDD